MEKKEKQAVYYFLGWLIVGFLICFIGVTDVFAAEYYLNYDTYQRYYDNTGTLTEVNSSWNESLQSYISGNLTTVSGSTGAAWLVSSPIPMVKGHQYSISFAFVERNNIALSSKNKIAISNTVNGAVTNYNNSSYGAETIYSKVTGNTTLSFVFKANSNSSFIVIPFTTTSRVTQNYSVTMFVMEDLGTAGLSQEELNTTINSQTNILNNSIQNSTDTITGEIDDMEQSILDSNKETQEVIKDQFNDCHTSYNLLNYSVTSKTNNGINYTVNNDNTITLSGTATADSSFYLYTVNNPLNLKAGTYTLSGVSGGSNVTYKMLSYDTNWTLITQDTGNGGTFTINQDLNIFLYIWVKSGQTVNTTIKPMLNEGSTSKPYESYGEEICSNKIDETNEQLGNLNDSLNDSNIDGSLNGAGNFFDSFQSTDHGGLSGIITAPLVAINEMLNTTCNPMTATFKGKELSLPCGYEFWNKLGAIQDFLNVVLGGMLCYNIVKKLFKLIERIKNPEDDRVEVMDL